MFSFDFYYLDRNWNTLFVRRLVFKSYREAYFFRNSELLNKCDNRIYTIQISLNDPALVSVSKINPKAAASKPVLTNA